MNIKAKRNMDRNIHLFQMWVEKFFQRLFLTVEENVTVSPSNDGAIMMPGFIVHVDLELDEIYFNKETTMKRGPFKLTINSEHRGGEKYKNFVYVYFFGLRIFSTVWRTEKGNAFPFSTVGHDN